MGKIREDRSKWFVRVMMRNDSEAARVVINNNVGE